ncbi:MAG: bifunctional hydroxymethylpyrimidine kinase/phosphomethylpyrimidine kinase [Bacteroidales bacterium]|nr:bifunctional hydroxymethylpyrimidine kinase/phosphomethylpyrimidine kinase [Bacteroidales bacterium]
MKQYHKVITIAGTDSGGGAGVPADIKAISANGGYAACVITAVTAQNTLGVTAVHDIPPEIIKAQASAVFSDIGADAVKIGMLSKTDTVNAVADILTLSPTKNIVLDPVMVSTSGHRLLQPDAIDALRCNLMPKALLITPNIPEAEVLLGEKITSQSQLADCARRLAGIAGNSVLLKAGHLEGADTLVDVLYNVETGKVSDYPSSRVDTVNTHGTGCTLSAAIASYLALGFAIEDAIYRAEDYLHNALSAGAEYKIGEGHGPVKHFEW